MASTLKITKVESAIEPVAFRDLAIGELYDTNSCYGLCIKIGDRTAISLSTGTALTAWTGFDCYRVRAGLKFVRTG